MSTMTLKNAKGEGDFLRLRFWGTVLLMLGALLALGAGSVNAAPLAGTTIGNQASATYADNNGVNRITVSNSVITTVSQIFTARLDNSQTRVGAPNQTVTFPHTVTNSGNGADSFNLTVGTSSASLAAFAGGVAPTSANAFYADANCDGVADNNINVTSVGPVAGGGVACFVAQVTLSASTSTSSFNVHAASVTSAGSTVTNSPNLDTVAVTSNAVINITKSINISTGPGGTRVVYQLTYRNTGNLSAGSVVVADVIPTGATYVPGSGKWGASTASVLTDLTTDQDVALSATTTPYGLDYGVATNSAGVRAVVAILQRVDPGVQGIIEYQATMPSTGGAVVLNTAQFCYLDQGSTGTVQPSSPAAVQTACTAVQATAGATTPTAADVTTITGIANPNQTNTVPFTVQAATAAGNFIYNDNGGASDGGGPTEPLTAAAAALLNDNSVNIAVATAGQGAIATWDTFVVNAATAGTDVFNIYQLAPLGTTSNFPAGTTFLLFRSDGVTPLTDSNGDGTLDTGPVVAGASYRVRVTAILPPSIGAGPFNAVFQAQSTNSGQPTNNVGVRLYVAASTVDVRNGRTASGDVSAGTVTTPVGFIGTSASMVAGGGTNQNAAGEAAPVTIINANPASTVRYKVDIVNTGTIADAFDLAMNVTSGAWAVNSATNHPFTTPTSLPAGFSATFYSAGASTDCSGTGAQLANTGVIAGGATRLVCLEITIPAGAVPATYELFVRALSPSTVTGVVSSSADVKHDRLVINSQRAVTLTPNNSGQIFPGGSIQYCHTVTNAGNTTETLVLGQGNQSLFNNPAGNGWSQFASVYVDGNNNCILDGAEGLAAAITSTSGAQVYAPGDKKNYIVVVQAPGSAAAGQSNVSSFSVVNLITALPANPTATDTTTVVVGQITLLKQQATDTNCDGTLDGAQATFTTAPILATGSTQPGQCIVYQVTATNIGTQNATNVVINDSTPPNTTLNVAPTGTACTAAISSGAVAAVASVTCTSTGLPAPATLAAGASMTLTYRVRIDP